MHHLPRNPAAAVMVALILVGCSSGQRRSPAAGDATARQAAQAGLTELAGGAPSVRRIASRLEIDQDGRPSPDGRVFSGTDWSTGDLILRDFANGTERRITDIGPAGASSDYADASIISPDGRLIAYGWYVGTTEKWELRVAVLHGPDSGRVRVVYSDPAVIDLVPHAWTPDGSEVIATVRRGQPTSQIVALAVDAGEVRLLRARERRHPENLTVSPDGRWLAYDAPSAAGDRDVHVISMSGTGGDAITSDPGNDVVMGWTSGGARLLVNSERRGTPSVWALGLANGKVVGDPLLVRADMWRSNPAGMAADGTAFYYVLLGERDVYTVPVDPVSGAIRSGGTSLTGGNELAPYQAADWSSDGEYVAYSVQRGAMVQPFAPEDVIVRSVTRGDVRRVSSAMRRIFQLRWLRDRRSILLFGIDDAGSYGFFRMLIADGSLTQLLTVGPDQPPPVGVAMSPDRSRVIFTIRDSTGVGLRSMDTETGAVSEIRRIATESDPGWASLALSPDGTQAAFALRDQAHPERSRLVVAPLGDGPVRVVYQARSGELLRSPLAWAPNGGHLLFLAAVDGESDSPVEVRRLALDDGTVLKTGLARPGIRTLRLSPDGGTLLFGIDGVSMEMWAMAPPDFGPAEE